MTRFQILTVGCLAAAIATTPVMAQEATQEPGMMGQHYPNVDYMTGGYGVRASPGPRYFYRRHYYGPGPADLAAGVVSGAVGTAAAIVAAPLGGYGSYGYGPYAYYDGPVY
jgi:hypothetical protein